MLYQQYKNIVPTTIQVLPRLTRAMIKSYPEKGIQTHARTIPVDRTRKKERPSEDDKEEHNGL